MNQKAVIFLADGMADEPLPELNGKTPLEAVDTPAMDSIARSGVNGTFLTLPEGLPGGFAWQGGETPLSPGENRIAR